MIEIIMKDGTVHLARANAGHQVRVEFEYNMVAFILRRSNFRK